MTYSDDQAGVAEIDRRLAGLRDELGAVTPTEVPAIRAKLAVTLVQRYEVHGGPASDEATSGLSEAIGHAQQVLAAQPCDASDADLAMFAAGVAHYYRFGQREDPADLDAAARHLTVLTQGPGACAPDGEGPDLRRNALALLGEILTTRYRSSSDDDPARDADLSEAIRIVALLYQDFDDEGTSHAGLALELGALHYERYKRRAAAGGGGTDLDEAIMYWRRASEDEAADPAVAGRAIFELGEGLSERVLSGAYSAADVDEGISALARGRQGLGSHDNKFAVATLHEGVMLGVRFMTHGGSLADRQAGIAALRSALGHRLLHDEIGAADMARIWLGQLLMTPFRPQHFGSSPVSVDISLALANRFNETFATDAAQGDATEAVHELSQISENARRDPDVGSTVAMLLGMAVLTRGARRMSAEDVNRVIDFFAEALRIAPLDAAGAAELAAMYAVILAERVSQPGNDTDIEPAVSALELALVQLHDRHAFRPVALHYLGVMLGRRGLRRSAPADITAGISALTEALALMAEDHLMRPATIGSLGAALMSGVQFGASAAQVDRAIRLLAEALRHPHPDPAKRAALLCCYGQALHVRAIRDRAHDGFTEATTALREAEQEIGKDHPLHPYLLLSLATMLSDQYDYVGSLESLDAAAYYLDEVETFLTTTEPSVFDSEGADLASVRATRGHVRLRQASRRDNGAIFDSAIADLEHALGALPHEHPTRPQIASDLSWARIGKAAFGQDIAGLTQAASDIVQAVDHLPAAYVNKAALTSRSGIVLVGQGLLTRDLGLLDKGIAQLRAVADDPGLLASERARLNWAVGLGLVTRYDVSRASADIEAAVGKLEAARNDLATESGNPAAAGVLAELAGAYRKRADPARRDNRRAVETGIEALREQAGDVLLQTDTERALTMARKAAADATEIASWSRSDGAAETAVQALELGRGLVLHAATSAARLPELLREAGYDALADEWAEQNAALANDRAPDPGMPWERLSAEGASRLASKAAALIEDLPAVAIPDDLRHHVMLALARSGLDQALLSPLSTTEIAAVMRATGTDIVAYLMASGEHGGGHAIIVRQDGSAQELPLPRLDVSPGSPAHACATAQLDALSAEVADPRGATAAAARDRWFRRLEALSDWAWPAAISPLLDAVAAVASRLFPRLLLIPFDLLGMVPWHAARYRESSGAIRFACQKAVFSYAVSARQLADAVSRDSLPIHARQVLVADPVAGSLWATWETQALRAAYYPDATILSRRTPRATPTSVLAALPGGDPPSGAALLHLSCHALTAPSPADSQLRLRADQESLVEESLPVDQILRQAVRKPAGAPGGLVVLSACVSDLSTTEYDEALTLASAFMTAGAVSVVGTRWQVPDVRTAILMFMFHHYLSVGQPPGDALRCAQAWMLNADREVPAEMPRILADEVPLSNLGDLVAWAGFVHQGGNRSVGP